MTQKPIAIHWFRRDLRLKDNAALYHALKSGLSVLPIFIFDRSILEQLSDPEDLRVNFIHKTLTELKSELREYGSDLEVFYGYPLEIWKIIVQKFPVQKVYTNRDYEPYALKRDTEISELLESQGIEFRTYKDHVIFEKNEILKDDGSPYTVFTPYSKKWKSRLTPFYLKPYPVEKYISKLLSHKALEIPDLERLGFRFRKHDFPSTQVSGSLISNYDQTRDFPALNGTSKLSIHYRFGTISIREKMAKAQRLNEKYFNELIWRDFYIHIMAHFPQAMSSAFKPAYSFIEWENDEKKFAAWCEGKTGYPIVDAGMRELNETGYMHNRVRMIVASFLCKHLLIDWRWGEAYFARKLLDYELACNNGGWQWAAGCGVDAAPYFRIFNPYLQTKKFDPDNQYIKKWIPEIGTSDYPEEIVNHEQSRERCLKAYKMALERK